jgi:hypothetical protein
MMLTNAVLVKISITLAAILALLGLWSAAQMKTERDREARRRNFESRVRKYQATEPTSVDLSTDSLRHFDFNFGAQNQRKGQK